MKSTILALLWLALIVAGLALVYLNGSSRRVPLATEADRALSSISISRDGTSVTFRATASNMSTVCVEPEAGHLETRACFTVGDVRRGRVGRR